LSKKGRGSFTGVAAIIRKRGVSGRSDGDGTSITSWEGQNSSMRQMAVSRR